MLCEYGCGQEGKYKTSTGKSCCDRSYNRCPKIRERNSQGVKKAHAAGRMKYDFNGNRGWRKGKFNVGLLKRNSTTSTETIRKVVLGLGLLEYKCAGAGCEISEWLGKKLTLELDHENGDRTDNRLKNLRFLCPNCHSQTPTFKGRNIRRKIHAVTDDEAIGFLKKHRLNVRAALLEMGMNAAGGNYRRMYRLIEKHALVAELVDALASGASGRKAVRVRVPPRAPSFDRAESATKTVSNKR